MLIFATICFHTDYTTAVRYILPLAHGPLRNDTHPWQCSSSKFPLRLRRNTYVPFAMLNWLANRAFRLQSRTSTCGRARDGPKCCYLPQSWSGPPSLHVQKLWRET